MKKSFLDLIPKGMEKGTCLVDKDGITLLPDKDETISFTIQMKDVEGGLAGAKRIAARMFADADYPVVVTSDYFKEGETERHLCYFSIMIPGREVTVDYELAKLDSSSVFVDNLPGMLKGMVFGYEIALEEVDRIRFTLSL